MEPSIISNIPASYRVTSSQSGLRAAMEWSVRDKHNMLVFLSVLFGFSARCIIHQCPSVRSLITTFTFSYHAEILTLFSGADFQSGSLQKHMISAQSRVLSLETAADSLLSVMTLKTTKLETWSLVKTNKMKFQTLL